MAEIQQMLGRVSRQRASEIVARLGLPAPLGTLASGRIWSRHAVEAWFRQKRPTQRGDDK